MKSLIIIILSFFTLSAYSAVKINVEILTPKEDKVYLGHLLIKETNIYLISPIQVLNFKIIKDWVKNNEEYGYILEDSNQEVVTLVFIGGVAFLNTNEITKYKSTNLILNIINP